MSRTPILALLVGGSVCAGLVVMAMSLGTAAVVWFGAMGVLEGRLTVGDILVFLAYLGMLYQPMSAFSQGANVLHSSRSQLLRVFLNFKLFVLKALTLEGNLTARQS